MTTVATDGKSLATDAQWTGDFKSYGGLNKILQHEGHVFGAAGTDSSIYKFYEWIKAGQPSERPQIRTAERDSLIVLELTPTGRLFAWYDDLTRVPAPIPFAVGSGGPFAMAAMLCGKSPRDAVKIAAQLDPGTSGKISNYTVPGRKKRPKS